MLGTDGREYPFYPHKAKNNNIKSSLHLKCRDLLIEMFPATIFSEEVPIKINRKQTLYLDFYIASFRTAVEVHGKQHFETNSHFYKSDAAFKRAQWRDILKKDWCTINEVNLIELLYNETVDEWRDKLRRQIGLF